MDSLFTVWHAESQQAADEIILPDGCRDLILRQQQASRPDWFVSPLFDCATSVKVSADTRFVGYIIHPGAVISEHDLLATIHHQPQVEDDIENILVDFVSLDHGVAEALGCLASGVDSVKKAAQELGVSHRILQRLMYNQTNRSPSYWLQLAKVRRAAKALTSE